MATTEFTLRPMRPADWDEVGELIRESTNAWYVAAGKPPIFLKSPGSTRVFCEIYEALDPGCCIVAEHSSGKLAGSCFYHPRETHVSIGIMNVHPEFFRRGVAGIILRHIIEIAERMQKPLRLVSSAMNLDSFSLYTRAGFVPRAALQDMFITVPAEGVKLAPPGIERVRPARMEDVPAMVELEMQISRIRREKDYRFMIENRHQVWHVSVVEGGDGTLEGFLASIKHPASNMLGPGVAKTQAATAALVAGELRHHAGRSPVFLVPVECAELVQTLYKWGARNVETHFAQVRGRFEGFHGVVMPTFMPETG